MTGRAEGQAGHNPPPQPSSYGTIHAPSAISNLNSINLTSLATSQPSGSDTATPVQEANPSTRDLVGRDMGTRLPVPLQWDAPPSTPTHTRYETYLGHDNSTQFNSARCPRQCSLLPLPLNVARKSPQRCISAHPIIIIAVLPLTGRAQLLGRPTQRLGPGGHRMCTQTTTNQRRGTFTQKGCAKGARWRRCVGGRGCGIRRARRLAAHAGGGGITAAHLAPSQLAQGRQ